MAPDSGEGRAFHKPLQPLPADDTPHLIHRHIAIPEEEEPVEMASDPLEPLTHTGHAPPSVARQSTPYSEMSMKMQPNGDQPAGKGPSHFEPLAASPPALQLASDLDATRPTLGRLYPSFKLATMVRQPMSPEKGGDKPAEKPEKPHLGRRVGSFVKSKWHRTDSPKPDPGTQHHPPPARNAHGQKQMQFVKTGVDGPAEVSSPATDLPRARRFSRSFSLSVHNSPKYSSSPSHSPKSPSSPSSTIPDRASGQDHGTVDGLGKTHSSAAAEGMHRTGVKWAGTGLSGRGTSSRFARRRSASAESVPMVAASASNTVGLIDTFSKHAAEGVGLKARRLSVSLPDEFVVSSCELDKEFKSSSLMPGKRGKVLGRGATSEVRIMARKGTLRDHHEDLVAVKEFRARERDEPEEEYMKKIKSEYSIAKSLHHPNIVVTVRLCYSRGRWNHVMEFCRHGELFSLVERKLFSAGPEGHYSVADRLCFFKQLLRGVNYLHDHGIAHRDIKLENLLLDNDGHLKISDFGVAEVFSGEHPGLRQAGGECGKNMGEIRLSKPGICGSMPYIAPEVLEKKADYDPRALDTWSCAIVFLTMTFGGCPWQAAKPEYEYYAAFKKGWDTWLAQHPDGQISDGPDGHPRCGKLFSLINPPNLRRLILRMLHPDPPKRITIKEIMATTCVKNIDCCCPQNFEEGKCCGDVDASKATARDMLRVAKSKTFLHRHIPPEKEKKFVKAMQHRFDMGNGWN